MTVGTLDLGTLHLKMRADKDTLAADLREGERETEQSGKRMGRSILQTAMEWARSLVQVMGDSGRKAGERTGEEFTRGADGRLRDAKGRFVAAGKGIGDAVGAGAGTGIRSIGDMFGMAGTGAVNLATNLWNLIPAVLALMAAMVALLPIAYLVGGVLGSLPALATGGLAAVGTLALGFWGLSDAFKDTSRSGGSMVDRARQVALAERRLADANREALAAQRALNEAREEAAERLADLGLSLEGARLDERDAVKALADAERELARAKATGRPETIAEATRAYERADYQLRVVRDRVGDLELEHRRASAAGVEGSDQVQAALERQRRATEGVADATYELGRAGRSVGAAAAQQSVRLASSAQRAVNMIKSLKGEFTSLRLDVQERLFAGSDIEIRRLWDAWLPMLRLRLGSMATMFNGLFKTWAATSRKPEFIANISAGWEHVERLIDRVGKAVAGPGLDAFGKLSRHAGPMLDAIGDALGGIVEDFSAWIDEAEQSGELQRFFERAGEFFTDTVDIGKSAVSIIGSLVDILISGEEQTEGSPVKNFKASMEDLAAWFDDPANKQKIVNFLKKIEDFMIWVRDEAIPEVQRWINKIQGWADKLDSWADKVGNFKDRVVGFWRGLRDGISVVGLFDGVPAGAKAAFNLVAGYWNRTIGSISLTIPNWVPITGGESWSFPRIPHLAEGGLVRATPGGRPVVVAEAGEDEIVSPEGLMRRIVAEELRRVEAEMSDTADARGGGLTVEYLEVKAYNDRFSLKQIEDELALHGVH